MSERASVPLPGGARLEDLADELGGRVDPGLSRARVTHIASIDEAIAGDLAPLLSRRYVSAALAGEALLLVDAELAEAIPSGRRWVHPRAPLALAQLLARCRPVRGDAEVHVTAMVHPSAVILAGARVDARSEIGPGAVIYGGAHVMEDVTIGAGCVVGREGFGWVKDASGAPMRVPQLGGVRIERGVELGPLCTVDAGTLGPTIVGEGAKLDAQVHVGHNAHIGARTLVAAQCGFAGSVKIGRGCLIGGQVGVADHVRVGDGAILAAKAGVIGDVPPGATFAGYPAVERTRWLRATAHALRGRAAAPEEDAH